MQTSFKENQFFLNLTFIVVNIIIVVGIIIVIIALNMKRKEIL